MVVFKKVGHTNTGYRLEVEMVNKLVVCCPMEERLEWKRDHFPPKACWGVRLNILWVTAMAKIWNIGGIQLSYTSKSTWLVFRLNPSWILDCFSCFYFSLPKYYNFAGNSFLLSLLKINNSQVDHSYHTFISCTPLWQTIWKVSLVLIFMFNVILIDLLVDCLTSSLPLY